MKKKPDSPLLRQHSPVALFSSLVCVVVGLLLGSLAMTAVMCLCNLIFTPLFMGGTAMDVAAMLIPIIIPFNLVKALGNSAITYLVYKPISKLVFGREQPVLTTSAK